MESKTLTFKFERTTKNTCKYEEQPTAGQPAMVGSLYVQKWAAGDPPPPTLTVTIAEAK